MSSLERTPVGTVMVVVNEQGQYSVWASERPVPAGWSATGVTGSTQQCLDHIAGVWTDVLPRSARRPASGDVRREGPAPIPVPATSGADRV